jgi:hypothetical protein
MPRNRVLVEKLIVAQLFKKLLAFYSTQRIINVFTRDHQNPGPYFTFRNMLVFYREELLFPSPNPQAGGPPLSAVDEYLQLPSTCSDELLRPEPVEAPHGDDSGHTPRGHVLPRSGRHYHHRRFENYEHRNLLDITAS